MPTYNRYTDFKRPSPPKLYSSVICDHSQTHHIRILNFMIAFNIYLCQALSVALVAEAKVKKSQSFASTVQPAGPVTVVEFARFDAIHYSLVITVASLGSHASTCMFPRRAGPVVSPPGVRDSLPNHRRKMLHCQVSKNGLQLESTHRSQ